MYKESIESSLEFEEKRRYRCHFKGHKEHAFKEEELHTVRDNYVNRL
jgi:hypothetical protein